MNADGTLISTFWKAESTRMTGQRQQLDRATGSWLTHDLGFPCPPLSACPASRTL
jgi:hypothetical protein